MVRNLKVNPIKEGIILYKIKVLKGTGINPLEIQKAYGVSKRDLRRANTFNEDNGYKMNLERKEIIEEYKKILKENDEKIKREIETKQKVENVHNLVQTLQDIVDEKIRQRTR